MTLPRHPAPLLAGIALLTLGACSDGMDFDLRGGVGNALDTAPAARNATADRPKPDDRGIISYPNYQVAVARRGDTLNTLAQRIGVNVTELARYNGIEPNDPLRRGEVIALPGRVAEPSGGPIRPGGTDITAIAGQAIDRAGSQTIETTTLDPATTPAAPAGGQTGVEPVRHKVERGETAFSIARLYDVSIRSLADWNGLGSDFHVREGQYLLIPVALPGGATEPFDERDVPVAARTEPPGAGSPTPEPPSAAKPLPAEKTVPVAQVAKPADAPDLGSTQTQATSTRMGFPVRGDIIRAYAKGKNDGIDIAAAPGTAVKAADKGVVAAITQDTNGAPIIVVKHANNLLTVYSNVDKVTVKKGTNVQRGEKLAEIPASGAAAMHFEVRDGFDSVDPVPFLTE